ncbi:TetR/AcrR family transcriptional regulator [Amycolatopsis sp. NPDC059027]|uniref:TetR/AcrR family transcriptional regulator n=1 Tax=unclassified Amycolatopsis TaxID=2618356 RepID=UPI0036731FEF
MSATSTPGGRAPTGSRLERRKQQTRQRLYTAALELFAARGFDATTYDEIAQRADVARQTAFNYFPRKEDFIKAWVEHRRERLRELLTETAFRRAPAAEQLAAHLRALAKFNEDDRHLRDTLAATLSISMDMMVGEPPPDAFAESIRLGQEHGEFDPAVDPELAAEVIFDSYLCTLGRWLRQDTPAPLGELLLAKLSVILDGLGSPR